MSPQNFTLIKYIKGVHLHSDQLSVCSIQFLCYSLAQFVRLCSAKNAIRTIGDESRSALRHFARQGADIPSNYRSRLWNCCRAHRDTSSCLALSLDSTLLFAFWLSSFNNFYDRQFTLTFPLITLPANGLEKGVAFKSKRQGKALFFISIFDLEKETVILLLSWKNVASN